MANDQRLLRVVLALTALGFANRARAADARHEVLDWLNTERSAQRLAPLILEEHLCITARQLAEELARSGELAASQPAPALLDRVRHDGFEAYEVSEVLAQGMDIKSLLSKWRQESPSTYRDFLSPKPQDVGIGVTASHGSVFMVLLLARPWSLVFAEQTQGLKDLEKVRLELLAATNDARRGSRLPPLRRNAALSRAAQQYADDMLRLGRYGHQGPSGDTVLERVKAQGYSPQVVGENLASGPQSVREVIDAWLRSPGHRANLLSPDFSEVGFGLAYGKNAAGYQVLWVQCFGAPNGGLLQPRKPPG